MLKVFVTNLAQYNAGKLVGKWIELPRDDSDLKKLVNEILGTDEEYFVTEYESAYKFHLSEYEDIFAFNEKLTEFQEVAQRYDDNVIKAAFRCLAEFEDVLNCLKDDNLLVFENVHSTEELGFAVVDDGLFDIEIPEALKGYVNYESIGNDWECNGTVIYEDLGVAVKFY